MAQEKKFKICTGTRCYLEGNDGEKIEIPVKFKKVKHLCTINGIDFFTYGKEQKDWRLKYGVFAVQDSKIKELLPPKYKSIETIQVGNYDCLELKEPGSERQLWSMTDRKFLLGGKKYLRLGKDREVYNGLVMVSFQDARRKFADIETGEEIWQPFIILPERVRTKNTRFVAVFNDRTWGAGVFDTKTRRQILKCRAEEIGIYSNYIVATYRKTSSIYTLDGVLILSNLPRELGIVFEADDAYLFREGLSKEVTCKLIKHRRSIIVIIFQSYIPSKFYFLDKDMPTFTVISTEGNIKDEPSSEETKIAQEAAYSQRQYYAKIFYINSKDYLKHHL